MPFEFQQQPAYEALARLFEVAKRDTGQSSRVADFLLAWHNAEENKGWNPVDLWILDDAIADDMISVLGLIRQMRRYPDDLGFGEEMQAVWKRWR
jgi:hypothetical protein